MARVVRADTWESIGYFVELYGPLEPGAHGWICDAWRYADGSLHHQPPPLSARGQRPALPVKLSIPVRQPHRVDLELVVSPSYLDFMRTHPAFRPLPPRPSRHRRHR